jgi:hypothetical protein
MQRFALIASLVLAITGCSSDDSDKTGTGGAGGGGSGSGGAASGGTSSGGTSSGGTGGGSDVSCSDWCAHFYQDLQCDPAGEDTCIADCEEKKQSGDFLQAEAACQLNAADCAAWDDCGEQF